MSIFQFRHPNPITLVSMVYAFRMGSTKKTELTNQVESIPGWFSHQDQTIFEILLNYQNTRYIQGDLLEIGVYLGKSAVVLGAYKQDGEEVVVCDLFLNASDSDQNDEENTFSYNDLTRHTFERNYERARGELPKILECSSLSLSNNLKDQKFRFIHVDGSHLYEIVKHDVDFAIGALISRGGVIVMDDFRAQHTIGVSAVLWKAIFDGKLQPIIFSAAKAYLVPLKDKSIDINEIRHSLHISGLSTESLDLFPSKTLRVLGLSDSDLYNKNSRLTWWVPPVLLGKIKKLISFSRKS
jgi:hypothetical protein